MIGVEREGRNKIYHILYGRCREILYRWLAVQLPKHRRILGEAIRKHRKNARLSQEALAEQANLSPVYISRVECGKENISIDALVRVARAMEVSPMELFRSIR